IPQDLFGEFAPVMGTELGNGITRYRAGIFREYAKAVAARDKIRGKGYSDAFVVVVMNGESLSGSEARTLLAEARESENFVPTPVPATAIPTDGAPDRPEKRTDYYSDPDAAEAIQVEATRGLFYT